MEQPMERIEDANGNESSQDIRRKPCPIDNASLISRLLFKWPYPLLKLGLERALEDSDLPYLQNVDRSTQNSTLFDQIWEQEKRDNPKSPSLHRALLKDFLRCTWYVQPMMMLAASAKIVQAVALGFLVESFETGNGEGYQWASVLVVCGVIILFEHHHVFFITWRKGMQMRIASVAAIYAKSLRLPSTHQDAATSGGKIMNLASNDVERFLMCALFMSYLVWSPLQSIAILIVGWLSLGPAFAAGFALLVFGFIPLQAYLSHRFAFLRSKIASITDQRVTFVSQAIHGARVMKMSGYEWRFLDRIKEIRSREINQIQRSNKLKAMNEASFFMASVVISVVIYMVHVAIGGVLTPRDVFTVFSLLNVLQLEMTKHVALGVMGVSECFVSVSRIQQFLEFPELCHHEQHAAQQETASSGEGPALELSLRDVSCYWNHTSAPPSKRNDSGSDSYTDDSLVPALSEVNVSFRPGEITCIIGSVGSGKSALVQAIVGELPVYSGSILRKYRSLAYASQDPWIMDGTVQENILMGLEYDEVWYKKVVAACALVPDFSQFANGDQTVVGDRGVQCSGGQRARIGLARAIYRNADVLVCDDPLSAVDAKVGRQLFNEALLTLGARQGKIVILATHQHQYVNEAVCVLVESGRIQRMGSYVECVQASKGKLTAHTADDAIVDVLPNDSALEDSTAEARIEKYAKDDQTDSQNQNKESKTSGFVRYDTFRRYAEAMGGPGVVLAMIIVFAVTQGSVLLTIAWIGKWAERAPADQKDADIVATVGALACAVVVFSISRAVLSLKITVKASKKLHDDMTRAILRAKISFFDTNPLGRILNRFSADVGSNDDLLPTTLFDFLVMLFLVLGAVSTAIVVLPFALIVFPPLIWYFVSVRRVFVTSTRELKRLEGLARSPIFAMLSEALSGIATIRANDSVSYFRKKFYEVHDKHTMAFFSFIAASRWVGFRMDSIMFLLMSFVSFLAVLFNDQGWFRIDPAILGLSISLLLQLSGLFQWMIRQSAEVVNQFVAVERVLDYTTVEPEAPLDLEKDALLRKNEWPQKGGINVENLAVRYRPTLPRALDGASFSIPPGQRIGIVGRTGSGKSTVVQTLFRLLEAEEGSICIDDVDVSTIGLHALRTSMSVIPQVPTLFSGCTVRENLDLFGIHSDEAIRKALQDVHLLDAIEALPLGTNALVAENGSNFSVGQRQLLCLARAILRRNKILILDEASASVDRRTDQLLQASIQESFGDATIIAVAHRLDTVIDYDAILVLGNGQVLEYGPPADLLRKNGTFARMVQDTGETMARELRQKAFLTENRKKGS